MSSAVYHPKLSKRVLVFMGIALTLWLAATLGAEGLVHPIQAAVRLFEQLFGLNVVPGPT